MIWAMVSLGIALNRVRSCLSKPLLALFLAQFMSPNALGMQHKLTDDKPKKPLGVWQELSNKALEFEAERIHHVFAGMDAMLAKAMVVIEETDATDNQHKVSSLLHYLTGPADLNDIVARLKNHHKKELSELDHSVFADGNVESFLDAVRHLSKRELVTDIEAQDLLLEHSPLKPVDFIRLIENGAVENDNGHLVKLRTGTTYGDALNFNDDIMSALRDAQAASGIDFPDLPLMELLDGPYRTFILEAFDKAGLRGEDILSDAHVLSQMRKYLLFLNVTSRINWLKPNLTRNGASLNPVNASYLPYASSISATLLANAFAMGANTSFSNSLSMSPLGLSYVGDITTPNQNADWWLYYQNGYLGAGINFSQSFGQGTFWSNGSATFLSYGLWGGGWKDNISIGLTMQTIMSSTLGLGVAGSVSISRAHDVAYLGQVPKDDKIVAIRGLHKIEINDKKGSGFAFGAAANFYSLGVPVTIAFKAGTNLTR
ncbi:MAG TPA: hypothetical protein VEK06_04515, partial [Myxococcota bacterium]|nr:hypothetical protein [Myxococcota bacterium]